MKKKKNALANLDALINKAKPQGELEACQQRARDNLNLFKRYGSHFYEEYINYQPTSLKVGLDKNGQINLINIHNREPVYDENPKEFCLKQVNSYMVNPTYLKTYHQVEGEHIECLFYQTAYLDEIKSQFAENMRRFQGNIYAPVGLMFINGCGLGFHIIELLKKLDVQNLCIIDNHKDSFYASLHTIDWGEILKYFSVPGRSLHIAIEQNFSTNILFIHRLLFEAGLHNAVNAFQYQHLHSLANEQFFNQLQQEYHSIINGFGFLEDEQISIAHTVANLNQNVPVLNHYQTSATLPPVFLVGNGPSLDNLIDTLKVYQDRTIIISCGSAIGTLIKNNIMPDFHVEMERTNFTTDKLRAYGFNDTFKQINLLTLNTLPPDAIRLFKKAYMAIKDNDAGAQIINDYYNDTLPILKYCNPTCTNTGLSFALRLGFKHIFLVGIDLGMKNKREHHAKSSQYFDKSNELLYTLDSPDTMFSIKGNFSDEVYTTFILDKTRIFMSQLLSENNTSQVFNLNDGAFIEGATPYPYDQIDKIINYDLVINKNQLIEDTCQHHFSLVKKEPLTADMVKHQYLSPALDFLKKGIYQRDITSIEDLHQENQHYMQLLLKMAKRSPVSYSLIHGSMQMFFNLMEYACLGVQNDNELKHAYQQISATIQRFNQFFHAFLDKDCIQLRQLQLNPKLRKY